MNVRGCDAGDKLQRESTVAPRSLSAVHTRQSVVFPPAERTRAVRTRLDNTHVNDLLRRRSEFIRARSAQTGGTCLLANKRRNAEANWLTRSWRRHHIDETSEGRHWRLFTRHETDRPGALSAHSGVSVVGNRGARKAFLHRSFPASRAVDARRTAVITVMVYSREGDGRSRPGSELSRSQR